MSKNVAPYGTWTSPITADLILADAAFERPPHVVLDGDDVYWEEQRAAEEGRTTIVRATSEGIEEITPAPFDARSRVHSYGGGAFTVAEGVVFFSNKRDDRVYRVTANAAPVALTPADTRRYADLQIDARKRRIIAVCEDHRANQAASIVAFAMDAPSEPEVLASGRDFYAALDVARDGRIAFVAWDHPNMPWDETSLGVIEENVVRAVAAEPGVSYAEPRWAYDGALHWVSDATGWWNLYREGVRYGPERAEATHPHWTFGGRSYAHLGDGGVLATYGVDGFWRLAKLDPRTDATTPIPLPYSDLARVVANDRRVVLSAGAPDRPSAVVELADPPRVLREGQRLSVPPEALSKPEPMTYPSGGATSHLFFYPPTSADEVGPDDERPPLIVLGHGGPTGSAGTRLDLSGVQYWTTRGFAVAKVDYRGSTGYGTAYRRALDGGWGEYDVEDCVAAARYLAEIGRIDPARTAIVGGSAGGLTVLAALAFHDVFAAGVSYYGISDLELLAAETHKFESRYIDRLIGPIDTHRDVYRARSPIHAVERITAPVLFFQGAEDVVVPPNQTERMVDALRARGVPATYELFEGEGHGFRRDATLRRCLQVQHAFFAEVFGF